MERKGKFTNPYWLLKCWCVPSIPAPPPWHSWARSSPQLWSRGTSGGWCWPCASSSAAPLSDACCSWSSSSVWFGILVDLQESVSKQRSLSDSPNSICDIGLWDFLFGADCQAENWPNIYVDFRCNVPNIAKVQFKLQIWDKTVEYEIKIFHNLWRVV